ncbi:MULTISPECIES: CBS domain-containing protein [Methanoculleus]|uniref:Transcriptional regulator, XRE family n=2 Tax=Methanoculleus TaxID=45989 RepID=A3CV21_METMJ|nr:MULTISPECIES: CBS domain-containing protein [Methanoculleus]ABN57221.1 transcriptional regulator, XRE family [Methanoculleus marisnigri JR1]MCC7556287.1 CBS domain-containing protein [Methanoculleus marisnigri]UYU18635.1 CBS domain-containing protein [Methanoculleus submarinus]
MEIPTPAELREKRLRMGLKQADVARMAGISQSMVARIEAGSVDPRVSTLAKIVDVLRAAEHSAITAADVMHTPVLSVAPDDPVGRAVEIMGTNGISQLPVLEKDVPVGCISESAIMNAMEEGGLHHTHRRLVQDYLEPGFPTVPPTAPIDTVVHLLHHSHAVVVIEKGKVQGVITKHDLISLIT